MKNKGGRLSLLKKGLILALAGFAWSSSAHHAKLKEDFIEEGGRHRHGHMRDHRYRVQEPYFETLQTEESIEEELESLRNRRGHHQNHKKLHTYGDIVMDEKTWELFRHMIEDHEMREEDVLEFLL